MCLLKYLLPGPDLSFLSLHDTNNSCRLRVVSIFTLTNRKEVISRTHRRKGKHESSCHGQDWVRKN
eukprot:12213090-Ditylum_brightwellii.AAC.1